MSVSPFLLPPETNRPNPLFHKRPELKEAANWGLRRLIHFSIMCILAACSLIRAELYPRFAKILAGGWFVHLFNTYWLLITTCLENRQTMTIQRTYGLFRRVWESSSWRKLILPCVREHYLILSLRSLISKKSSKYIPKMTLSNQKIWIETVKAWKDTRSFPWKCLSEVWPFSLPNILPKFTSHNSWKRWIAEGRV